VLHGTRGLAGPWGLDLARLTHVDLFSGLGGGVLTGGLLGWRTVSGCEIDPWCRQLLVRRQNDSTIEPFPIWDDVRTFPGLDFRGRVGVVSGGFPCQDLSLAGGSRRPKRQRDLPGLEVGQGLEGARSGLWWSMLRVIEEIEPWRVYLENVPGLASRGLDQVLGGLCDLGFDCAWRVLSAAEIGAPHLRRRIWILASHPDRRRREGERIAEHSGELCSPGDESYRLGKRRSGDGEDHHPDSEGLEGGQAGPEEEIPFRLAVPSQFWAKTEPPVLGLAHGLPGRVDQLRAVGNGWVPQVAAIAYRSLAREIAGS